MRRRGFLPLFGTLAGTWPLAVRAQQKAMPVVGWLSSVSAERAKPFLAAFRQGLGETCYVEGQDVTTEYRWADGHYDRLPSLAADLVGRKVDVIATSGGDPSALAAKNATSTIPIVSVVGADPVTDGLVASFARPGGDLTGFSILNAELTPKRLEPLGELVPDAKVIALLVNPNSPQSEPMVPSTQEAARAKGVSLCVINARNDAEIDAAFASLAQLQAGGIVVQGDPVFGDRAEQLVMLAARHAVPAIYSRRPWTNGI
jgi:putative tryptophan/tyrosine transport system substrate-binding protein